MWSEGLLRGGSLVAGLGGGYVVVPPVAQGVGPAARFLWGLVLLVLVVLVLVVLVLLLLMENLS